MRPPEQPSYHSENDAVSRQNSQSMRFFSISKCQAKAPYRSETEEQADASQFVFTRCYPPDVSCGSSPRAPSQPQRGVILGQQDGCRYEHKPYPGQEPLERSRRVLVC